jgi:hypothetical protein
MRKRKKTYKEFWECREFFETVFPEIKQSWGTGREETKKKGLFFLYAQLSAEYISESDAYVSKPGSKGS